MTTGPAHWELLQRSRALDNQVRVISYSSFCFEVIMKVYMLSDVDDKL